VEVPCKPSQERVGEVERLVVCHDGRTQCKHVPCHRDLASNNKHGRVHKHEVSRVFRKVKGYQHAVCPFLALALDRASSRKEMKQ
jgi:hypothetical protein